MDGFLGFKPGSRVQKTNEYEYKNKTHDGRLLKIRVLLI
jgi:hypothetical protein